MDTPKHTAEPWIRKHGTRIYAADGEWFIAQTTISPSHPAGAQDEANATRIVACVNACKGLADPEAAIREAREALVEVSFLAHFALEHRDPLTLATIRAALAKLGG